MKFTSVLLLGSLIAAPALAQIDNIDYETRELSNIEEQEYAREFGLEASDLSERDVELLEREPLGFLKLFKLGRKAVSGIVHAAQNRHHNRDLEDEEDLYSRALEEELAARGIDLSELSERDLELFERDPLGFLKLFKLGRKAVSGIVHAVQNRKNRRDLEEDNLFGRLYDDESEVFERGYDLD